MGVPSIGRSNWPRPNSIQIGQTPNLGIGQPLGTIVRGYDERLGEGEFIYLQMAQGQQLGQVVTFNGYGPVVGIPPPGSLNAQYQAVLALSTAPAGSCVGVAT